MISGNTKRLSTPTENQVETNTHPKLVRVSETYLMKGIRKRKPYNYVNSGFRRYLLHLVRDLNYSIKDAAGALGINYSTAKTIIQVYNK